MDFNEIIDRRGTHSVKWDAMEARYGVSPDDGISMWVADMDFRPPQAVSDALKGMHDHGLYGYYGDDASYRAAICGWMQRRHKWHIEPDWIFSTHGLVHATGLSIQTCTQPGDGVILLTPVYHAFAHVIRAAKRQVVECELVNNDGRYEMDFATYDKQMTGNEKMLILCSPHNPGGRVWSREELQEVADFCVKHDLILVSDEIHHDLVFAGNKHHVMANVAPEIADRLIMMTATTKTFNIAGAHIGNVIISNPDLRAAFSTQMTAGGISPNRFGLYLAEAAYDKGEEWLEELLIYLDENKRVFDAGMNGIPGLRSMKMDATYLAWVDFSGTGMERQEYTDRVHKHARIAPNDGPTFGKGGDGFLRFNIACPRPVLEKAISRMQAAFKDLQ